MTGVVLGGIVNIVLDIVLVFPMQMGILPIFFLVLRISRIFIMLCQ